MKPSIILGSYFLLVVTTISLVGHYLNQNLLAESHFLNWDAAHYFSISQGDYSGFKTAFFPLFPMTWRFLGFTIYGIVLFNTVVYLASFYWISTVFSFSFLQKLVFLTLPSSVFYYLPYTESLFFLFSSIVLIGLHKKIKYAVLIGLFLCVLSRPVFTVLVPALCFTYLFTETSWKQKVLHCIQVLGMALLGFLTVLLIQYAHNHTTENYLTVQQGWGNFLQIPKLPLTSWAGGFNVRLDGIALLMSILAGLFLILKIKVKGVKIKQLPPVFLLSVLYLVGIGLLVLLFRGGSLFSLNRFVFATPFFLIVFQYWLRFDFRLSKKQLIFIGLGIFLFWLLFGSYVHIQVMLKCLLITLYLLLIFIVKTTNKQVNTVLYLLIGLNFIFQIILFYRFLSNIWVG